MLYHYQHYKTDILNHVGFPCHGDITRVRVDLKQACVIS